MCLGGGLSPMTAAAPTNPAGGSGGSSSPAPQPVAAPVPGAASASQAEAGGGAQAAARRWNGESGSEVVSFMNSRVGQYLDDHPFVALSLLVFIAVSAIPVAFFLIFVISTTIVACMGVIVIEGVVVSVGGIVLLCALSGLGVLSLAVSGVLSICYIALSTLINYWHTPNYGRGGRNSYMQLYNALWLLM
uniref:Uncharacterized protein n=1 Tax=Gopherus agassizii TaxID=38772 RepID=A0A452GZC1_9SAUR